LNYSLCLPRARDIERERDRDREEREKEIYYSLLQKLRGKGCRRSEDMTTLITIVDVVRVKGLVLLAIENPQQLFEDPVADVTFNEGKLDVALKVCYNQEGVVDLLTYSPEHVKSQFGDHCLHLNC
jgi:hypothetical protein